MALVCDVHCDFVIFPCGILGQVWYLIVSIPDPCFLSYLYKASRDVFFSPCIRFTEFCTKFVLVSKFLFSETLIDFSFTVKAATLKLHSL